MLHFEWGKNKLKVLILIDEPGHVQNSDYLSITIQRGFMKGGQSVALIS